MINDVLLSLFNQYKAELIIFIGFMFTLQMLELSAKKAKKAMLDKARFNKALDAEMHRARFEASMSDQEKQLVERYRRRAELRHYARGR